MKVYQLCLAAPDDHQHILQVNPGMSAKTIHELLIQWLLNIVAESPTTKTLQDLKRGLRALVKLVCEIAGCKTIFHTAEKIAMTLNPISN